MQTYAGAGFALADLDHAGFLLATQLQIRGFSIASVY